MNELGTIIEKLVTEGIERFGSVDEFQKAIESYNASRKEA